MSEPLTSSQRIGHRARWKWFLALGAVLLILGIAGASLAIVLQLASLVVFGPLVLISSLLQFVTAIFAEKRNERLLHLAAAGVEMVLGFAIMANPPEQGIGLIALVAVLLIVLGFARLARALATRSRGRAWFLVGAVVALLLGISVLIGGPTAKLGFVGLCLAVDFLCHGFVWSAVALAERKPVEAAG
jgi:uncharacterized membrane protein HdeD (DUF308 family)